MNEKQIKEVMRLGELWARRAWNGGKGDEDEIAKILPARAALEAYLRTIGEPAGYSLPVGSIGEKKWAQLPKDCKPIGLVFQRIDAKTGAITEAGRVTWADWLAHPNGSKPAGDDLRWAAGVIEKYDDATIEACHMIDSTDCAAILTALAEYKERFDAPTPKRSEPESVNAELLEALKAAKAALKKVVEDCGGCEHEAGVCVCPELAAISKSGEAIAAAEAQQAGPENTRGNATAWLQWALHIIRERCPDVVGSHQFDWAGKALEDGFKAGPVRLTLNDVKDILAELNDMPCHVTEADLIVHVERFVLRANGLLPEDQAGNRGGES